ncbi:hypothetical protein M3Y96_00185500 [Aphelenchoides besseyi]|nr:hypothetical protein M3Y96_00185500 [Aphelenchoides besseyi]
MKLSGCFLCLCCYLAFNFFCFSNAAFQPWCPNFQCNHTIEKTPHTSVMASVSSTSNPQDVKIVGVPIRNLSSTTGTYKNPWTTANLQFCPCEPLKDRDFVISHVNNPELNRFQDAIYFVGTDNPKERLKSIIITTKLNMSQHFYASPIDFKSSNCYDEMGYMARPLPYHSETCMSLIMFNGEYAAWTSGYQLWNRIEMDQWLYTLLTNTHMNKDVQQVQSFHIFLPKVFYKLCCCYRSAASEDCRVDNNEFLHKDNNMDDVYRCVVGNYSSLIGTRIVSIGPDNSLYNRCLLNYTIRLKADKPSELSIFAGGLKTVELNLNDSTPLNHVFSEVLKSKSAGDPFHNDWRYYHHAMLQNSTQIVIGCFPDPLSCPNKQPDTANAEIVCICQKNYCNVDKFTVELQKYVSNDHRCVTGGIYGNVFSLYMGRYCYYFMDILINEFVYLLPTINAHFFEEENVNEFIESKDGDVWWDVFEFFEDFEAKCPFGHNDSKLRSVIIATCEPRTSHFDWCKNENKLREHMRSQETREKVMNIKCREFNATVTSTSEYYQVVGNSTSNTPIETGNCFIQVDVLSNENKLIIKAGSIKLSEVQENMIECAKYHKECEMTKTNSSCFVCCAMNTTKLSTLVFECMNNLFLPSNSTEIVPFLPSVVDCASSSTEHQLSCLKRSQELSCYSTNDFSLYDKPLEKKNCLRTINGNNPGQDHQVKENDLKDATYAICRFVENINQCFHVLNSGDSTSQIVCCCTEGSKCASISRQLPPFGRNILDFVGSEKRLELEDHFVFADWTEVSIMNFSILALLVEILCLAVEADIPEKMKAEVDKQIEKLGGKARAKGYDFDPETLREYLKKHMDSDGNVDYSGQTISLDSAMDLANTAVDTGFDTEETDKASIEKQVKKLSSVLKKKYEPHFNATFFKWIEIRKRRNFFINKDTAKRTIRFGLLAPSAFFMFLFVFAVPTMFLCCKDRKTK